MSPSAEVVTREDGRAPGELRAVSFEIGFQEYAEGSVLVSFGRTRVLCSATVNQGVPRWRQGTGLGWVTAEYSMLPRATHDRTDRESVRGRIGGRTHEISRLVGRSMRSSIDLEALGENTVLLDCDVLQADGGTRTAAITGGWVALSLALDTMVERKWSKRRATLQPVSAVSVGIVGGVPMLDLAYTEDSTADVDMNVVMTGDGRFIEVQGTAEQEAFTRAESDAMLDLAARGCAELFALQAAAVQV